MTSQVETSALADNTNHTDDRKTRPEKPNEEKFKTELAQAEKDHATLIEKLNAVKAKLDMTNPRGSPAQQRQQDLRSQLSNIRQQQQQLKSSKGNLQEKIKSLDAQIKSRIAEQKTARARVSFKTVEEIDQRIQQLEKQVDTGTMKLVDEKKALADISSLRKQRKVFGQFDEVQKAIDDVKAQVAELRKGLDDPEFRALSERYTAIANELDEIKAEQDEVYKNIGALRDEKSKLQTEQQEKLEAIKTMKNQYYKQKKAYADYEHEAYKARRERQKAQRDAYERERRKKVADERLEEASRPAYLNEIMTVEGLIRYFDPTSATTSFVSTTASSKSIGLAAQPARTVDGADIKGMKVIKRDDRDDNYFVGGGGKKGKKGKKNQHQQNGGGTASPASGTATPSREAGTTASTTTGGKFQLSIGIIEELGKVDIEPPMNQADVPLVVEKLKKKLDGWKKDQERKTKAVSNIEKAQKEIDRLEAEAQAHQSSGPSYSYQPPSSTANGPKDNDINDHKIDPTADTGNNGKGSSSIDTTTSQKEAAASKNVDQEEHKVQHDEKVLEDDTRKGGHDGDDVTNGIKNVTLDD